MAIPIWNKKTGIMVPRLYDEGMMAAIKAVPDPSNPTEPCYKLTITLPDGTVQVVPVYFAQPEQIFVRKIYPFITFSRDEITPALHRYMGVGQLEYKNAMVSGASSVSGPNGVTGFTGLESKFQAMPYDLIYTVSAFGRFESIAQILLLNLLKAFPPVGRLNVFDSLGLPRSYEAYVEGGTTNLHEIIDATTRARGYAFSVRVEGEIDLAVPYGTSSVTGIDLFIHRQDFL